MLRQKNDGEPASAKQLEKDADTCLVHAWLHGGALGRRLSAARLHHRWLDVWSRVKTLTRRHRGGHPSAKRERGWARGVGVGPSTPGDPGRILRFLRKPGVIGAAAGAVVIALVTQIALALLHPGEVADWLATSDPIGVMVREEPDRAVAAAAPFDAPAGRAGDSDNSGLAILPPESTTPVLLSYVHLYLRGQRNQSVAITNMSIRVLRCGPILRESLAVEGGRGGAQQAVKLSVLVDGPVPWLTEDTTPVTSAQHLVPPEAVRTTSKLEPYFRNNYILLQYDEKTVISIAAYATHNYCEWDVDIEYLVSGESLAHLIVNRTGVLRTGVDRSPFRITAGAALDEYQQIYVWRGEWVQVRP